MKKKFSLIELVVVIGVLGILAAIILPNTSDMKDKAHQSALNSNIRNLQTASDMFGLDHYGDFIGVDKPTLLVPQSVDFGKIKPEFVRNHSKVPNAKYWTDVNGRIWGSTTDAPLNVTATANKLDWEGSPSAASYKVYEVKDKQLTSSIVRYTFTEVQDLPKETTTYTGQIGKQYAVSAVDKNKFVTAPVGLGGQGGYAGYEDTLESGNNGQSGTTNPPTNPGNGGGTTTPPTPTPQHNAPVAVLEYTPSTNINIKTNLTWSTDKSTTSDSATIVDVEWKVNDAVVTTPPTKFDKAGTYKVEVRVKDNQDAWSEWVEKTITVEPDPNAVVMASAGPDYTLALKGNGDLYGFGKNTINLISSNSNIKYSGTPLLIMKNVRYTRASAKDSLAITKNNDLYVWGYDANSIIPSKTPQYIARNVEKAKIDGNILWYLTKDGDLYARGVNVHGLYGKETNFRNMNINATPNLISKDVLAFDMGYASPTYGGNNNYHGEYVKKDGSVWILGIGYNVATNDSNGNLIPEYTPKKVAEGAKDIYAVERWFVLLNSDNTLSRTFVRSYDGTISGENVKTIFPSYNNRAMVFLKEDDTLWGVGKNLFDTSISTPRKLFNDKITYASIGTYHSVLVKEDGTLWTQGFNYDGQLGHTDGITDGYSPNAIRYSLRQITLP